MYKGIGRFYRVWRLRALNYGVGFQGSRVSGVIGVARFRVQETLRSLSGSRGLGFGA